MNNTTTLSSPEIKVKLGELQKGGSKLLEINKKYSKENINFELLYNKYKAKYLKLKKNQINSSSS
jgi:hypothetical protein